MNMTQKAKGSGISMSRAQTTALFVVAFAIFTDMLVYGLVVPVLPSYAQSLGASQTAIGLLFGSYAIALFLCTPIFGVVSDRVGRLAGVGRRDVVVCVGG